jgi:hypothetical protein
VFGVPQMQRQTPEVNIEVLKEASWRGKTDIVKALLSLGTPFHCEVGVPGFGQELPNRYASMIARACARMRAINIFDEYSKIFILVQTSVRERY